MQELQRGQVGVVNDDQADGQAATWIEGDEE
jgi:hypothetical protein